MVARMSANTSDTPDQPAEVPHYHGHRMRLRERFRSAGADALSDYELLEMVLFRAIPRGDVKPLAKSLLKKFGSFAETIHAPETRLREIDGVGEVTITEIKLIAAAAQRIAKGQLQRRTLLSSWHEVIDYCRTSMAFADKEQLRLLHPWSALFIYFNPFYVASLGRPLNVPQVSFFVRFATRNCATREV
jgi:DNA repair protein RadC